MRVLMFGWEFPPHISGGLGTACYGMTKALAERDTQVIFVMPKASLDSPGSAAACAHLDLVSASGTNVSREMFFRMEGVTREEWQSNMLIEPVESLLYPYATPESYSRTLEWSTLNGVSQEGGSVTVSSENATINLNGGYGPDLMGDVHRYSLAASAIAMRHDFEVIHAHDWMTYPAGIMAKKLTGKPLVVHIHATEYDRSGLTVNESVARIERSGLHAADKVVAVSHLTKNLVVERYGVPPEKIEVVHNAVARQDVQHQYKVPERLQHEKRILFLGRVTFQKGPEYFIEAARMVLDHVDNVRFFMAGSGDMLPGIIRRAGQLRIGNRFHFTGFLRGAQVDRIFALSDLYVMPSVSEPFGITPLEAMLYDVPVLLSKQSGVSEVLNHALKVDFWDTKAMADKICAVLRYPCLARELVKNCREELKSIRWGNAADHLNRIYHELCSGGH